MSPSFFDNRVAAAYESWFDTPEGKRADSLEKGLLQKFVQSYSPGRLLEVGCGTGHFTRGFAELGFEVMGLDISPLMLETASKLSADTAYLRADAHALPFGDGSFDVTAIVTSLEFVRDPAQVLSEMMRVSSRAILLGVLNRRSLLSLSRRLKSLLGKKSIYSEARFFSPRELARLVTDVAKGQAISVEISHELTLYPRLWPMASGRQPLGAFIVMLAKLNRESVGSRQ
jgi:SAM-dependent methyltransferase